jgi:uncharacterized membrane protein YoaK (UPF0700 family)
MTLTHFQTMALFAFIVSVVFASLSRRSFGAGIRYTFWAFLSFLLVAIAIGWLMYPASH